MGVAGDVGGHADQDVLRRPALRSNLFQALDVVQRVEHDVADARLEGKLELGLGLGVAVQVDSSRLEAAPQSQRELAAGGDVARQSLLGKHAIYRRAGERLGGEQHVAVRVACRSAL